MPEASRGLSEVLGYALVFSLVLVTVALVTVGGVGQLESARDAEQLNNAERAFDLLASNVADVTTEGAPSRSTEISLRDAQVEVANPVVFTFRAIDDDDPTNDLPSEDYTVWPITYRATAGTSEIVYAGGAVIRTDRQGGLFVRRPNIVAANDRVVVPLVHTRSRSAQSLGEGTIRIRSKHANTDVLLSDRDGTYETFFMNVTSPRANLWAEDLDAREEFSCSLDTTGPTDVAECEVSDPARVHVALIQVDVELAD